MNQTSLPFTRSTKVETKASFIVIFIYLFFKNDILPFKVPCRSKYMPVSNNNLRISNKK